jgi:hypothetical protein
MANPPDNPVASDTETLFQETRTYEERLRTSVNDCPDEILLQITKYLNSRRDYYYLCLVKPFQRVATELLYYALFTCNLAALLRTVLECPERAPLIRYLCIDRSGFMDCPAPSNGEMKLFEEHISDLDLYASDEKRWIKDLNSRESMFGIVSALLLLRVPKLISFNTDGTAGWGSHDQSYAPMEFGTPVYWTIAFPQVGDMFTRSPPPRFEQLRKINVCGATIYIPQLASLFYLETLRELNARDVSVISSRSQCNWDSITFPNGTSGITVLRLDFCQIHESILTVVLRSCKALEILKLKASDFGNNRTVNFMPFSKALLRFSHCLRRLSICDSHYAWRDVRSPVIGCLADFEQLESLKVDFAVLFAAESSGTLLSTVLPDSIQHFQLVDTNLQFLENIKKKNGLLSNLLGNATSILPYLRYVGLECGEDLDLGYPQRIHYKDKRLLRELEQRGLKSYQYGQEWNPQSDSDRNWDENVLDLDECGADVKAFFAYEISENSDNGSDDSEDDSHD